VELNILYVLNEWLHKPTVYIRQTTDRRTDDSMITWSWVHVR